MLLCVVQAYVCVRVYTQDQANHNFHYLKLDLTIWMAWHTLPCAGNYAITRVE